MYRFFKFIAIILSLLLLVAQVVSVIFLPFDRVEFVLKLFLCSFAVLIMLNELEWWGMLRDSRLLWNWITRGVSSILLPFSFDIPCTTRVKPCHVLVHSQHAVLLYGEFA